MNIEKLEVGKVYKNYKELCEVLGESIKGGDAKKSQIKNWERYFMYEKDKYKFIITEIYKEPLPEIVNKRNLAEYIPYLELLLMQLLHAQEHKTLTISTTELATRLSMIHSDFREYFNKREKLSYMLNIEIDHVNDFIDTTNDRFKGAINTTISRLKGKQAILYEQRWMTMKIKRDEESDKNIEVYEFATEDDKEKIIDVRYEVLQMFGGDMNKLRAQGNLLYYYKVVDEILKESFGIHRAYEVHIITINHVAIENEYLKQLKKIYGKNSGELRSIIKELFSERNIEKANKRVEKAFGLKEEYGYGNLNKKHSSRLSLNYINDIQLLNEALIIKGVNAVYDEIKKC